MAKKLKFTTKTSNERKNRFDIDFIEFSFLVEACIPPRPIARTYFWQQVIDKFYYVLTPNERQRLYSWISRNPCYEDSLAKGEEDCLVFQARFNPDNQYLVKTYYKGKEETVECFKFGERYYKSKNTSISPEFIVDIEPLKYREE